MFLRNSLALAAAAACLLAAPALAADPAAADIRTTSVSVASDDLNLSADAGAQSLLRRIEAAAAEVCGPAPAFNELAPHKAYQACVSTAVRQAVTRASNPRLTALFERGATASLAAAR